MNKGFLKLSTATNTVFSYNDLAYYFGADKKKLIAKVAYYTKKAYLHKIKRGLYALNKNYNIYELATKIQKGSYISLETALKYHAINFQYNSTIFVIGYKNEKRIIDGHTIIFKVIKKDIRQNYEGIISEKGYVLADKYRAILDTLYLYKAFFYDNMDEIEWGKLEKLSKIYNSKILNKNLEKLKNNYKKNDYYS